jgi:hypothetical protein
MIYALPYPEPTDIPDVPEDMRRLAEAIEIALNNVLPIGSVMAWAGSGAAPAGWHLCDGTPHGSPELKAVTGSDNAPDLRNRFVLGSGTRARGATGGAETVLLTAATSGIGTHVHVSTASISVPAHRHHVQGIGPVWSSGHNTDHVHSGSTGWMDRNNWHDHGGAVDGRQPAVHFGYTRTGLETGSEVGGSGVNYITDNSGQGTSASPSTAVWGHQDWHNHGIPGSDINHLHGFTTGGVNTDHAHHTTVPAHWTDDGGGTGTATLNISASNPVNAAQAHENMPPFYVLTYIVKKY